MKKFLALAILGLVITGAQAHDHDGGGRWQGEGHWRGGDDGRGGWGLGPALLAGVIGGVLVQQGMAYAPPPPVYAPPVALPPPYPYGYAYPRAYGYPAGSVYGQPMYRHYHHDDDDE